MKVNLLPFTAVAVIAAAGIAVTPGKAQGPMFDRVNVNLPYAVTLGDTTLQPGDYTIREADSTDKSRVLLIYSDSGLKHEATVNTIPAEKNQTPDNTTVVLHHFGPDYYFDKIWIAGKNYGYEFPVPNNIKERQREREAPISVAATYEPPLPNPGQTQTAQTAGNQSQPPVQPAAPATAPGNDQVAQNSPPPEQAAQNTNSNQQQTQTSNSTQTTTTTHQAVTTPPENNQNTQSAQNAPAPPENNQNTADTQNNSNQQTAQNNTPAPDNNQNNSADRQADQNANNPTSNKQKLPATSADWVMMLLGGGGLSGLGLVLRRKR